MVENPESRLIDAYRDIHIYAKLMNFFIAKSIQGQAYLPSNEENEIIQKGDDNFSDLKKNESNQDDT